MGGGRVVSLEPALERFRRERAGLEPLQDAGRQAAVSVEARRRVQFRSGLRSREDESAGKSAAQLRLGLCVIEGLREQQGRSVIRIG